MKVSPIYTSDNSHRIAYVSNGRWEVQRDSGMKGQNATKGKTSVPHIDRWQWCRRPTTFNEARMTLLAIEKEKVKK